MSIFTTSEHVTVLLVVLPDTDVPVRTDIVAHQNSKCHPTNTLQYAFSQNSVCEEDRKAWQQGRLPVSADRSDMQQGRGGDRVRYET